mmetsp:Transcript_16198/g.44583  ORF Transcript_16198/g.44583 Transcript_16198/m.44583 type:complete len:173 (-) Transcript_16198:2657-3175(-)
MNSPGAVVHAAADAVAGTTDEVNLAREVEETGIAFIGLPTTCRAGAACAAAVVGTTATGGGGGGVAHGVAPAAVVRGVTPTRDGRPAVCGGITMMGLPSAVALSGSSVARELEVSLTSGRRDAQVMEPPASKEVLRSAKRCCKLLNCSSCVPTVACKATRSARSALNCLSSS